MTIKIELPAYNQLSYLKKMLDAEKLRRWHDMMFSSEALKGMSAEEVRKKYDKYWKTMSDVKQPCCEEHIIGTLSKIVDEKVEEINDLFHKSQEEENE